MIYKMLLLHCLVLCACAQKTARVRYVPPEHAAWFKFQDSLPEHGKQVLSGTMVDAMRIAASRFLPWDIKIPADAGAVGICLLQRQAWDVEISPWADNVTLVYFGLGSGACRWGGSLLLDAEDTYAVSVQEGRVLAISSEHRASFQFPEQFPRENVQSLEGNTAAAIQLAADDFLSSAPGGSSDEPPCVSQLTSYDVTAVPTGEGVTLVRFDVNDGLCPPFGPPSIVEGKKYFGPSFITTYAIDIRTMRILGINLTTRHRFME